MGSSAGFSLLTALGAWFMRWNLAQANKKIRASENETTLFYVY